MTFTLYVVWFYAVRGKSRCYWRDDHQLLRRGAGCVDDILFACDGGEQWRRIGGNQPGERCSTGTVACHVVYTVSNQWNVGFTDGVTIKNTGSTTISNWTLSWTWPGNQQMTESWDSNYSQTGANVKLTYMSYDATIAPGATLTGVGFNGSYSGSNPAPTAFYVNGTLCQ